MFSLSSKSTLSSARQIPRESWVIEALAPFLSSSTANGATLVSTGIRFQSRYFSSIIDFTLQMPNGATKRYLAKFPKKRKARGFAQLPARDGTDLEVAAKEYMAFLRIQASWPVDGATRFVSPVFFAASEGMLVFDYLDGTDLWSSVLVRHLALRRPLPDEWLQQITALGFDLARYHCRSSAMGQFDLEASCEKAEHLATRVGIRLPRAGARRWPVTRMPLAAGIKGFELRNVRVSGGTVWLYDPGHLKLEPPEADLARFLTSVRMLAWGTPLFALPLRTSPIEDAFLAGYRRTGVSIDQSLLQHLLRREMLKNWLSGLDVTRQKTWLPTIVRRTLERVYVHNGYHRLWRQLAQQN